MSRFLVRSANNRSPSELKAKLKSLIAETIIIDIYSSATLPPHVKHWCFDLFERNMRKMYEARDEVYDPIEKQDELFDPDSRFIILSSASTEGNPSLLGYIIWRFVEEETETERMAPVLYCYELQIEPKYHGKGTGRILVDLLCHLSEALKFEKTMLTVFKANTQAIGFYKRMNFIIDEISPSATGDFTEDYEILSRRTGV